MDLTCPYCDRRNEKFTAIEGLSMPEPGHLSICYACGSPAIFENRDGTLALRQATDEELTDPWLKEQVRRFNWAKRQAKAFKRTDP